MIKSVGSKLVLVALMGSLCCIIEPVLKATDTDEPQVEPLSLCYRRVSSKITPLCDPLSNFAQSASRSELQALKSLLRNKINILATGISSDASSLLDREAKLLKGLSAETLQLYKTISKKAIDLNPPSSIITSSRISFEAESFLAGIIKLLTEYSHTPLSPDLSIEKSASVTQSESTPQILQVFSESTPASSLEKSEATSSAHEPVESNPEQEDIVIIEKEEAQPEPRLPKIDSTYPTSITELKPQDTQATSADPEEQEDEDEVDDGEELQADNNSDEDDEWDDEENEEEVEKVVETPPEKTKALPLKQQAADIKEPQIQEPSEDNPHNISIVANNTLDDGSLLKLKEQEFFD